MKIAVFDSGIGGLPVLARLLSLRPHADFIYVSDTEHLPYGSKSAEEVTALVEAAVAGLDADALVLACNTATALAAKTLRVKLPCPVYGIEPAVKPARMAARGRITVLCTPATARAKAEEWHDLCIVTMPDLACRIEADRSPASIQALTEEVAAVSTRDVVLGCTHYSFLAAALKKRGFSVYDGADGLVRNVARGSADEGTGTLYFRGKDYARELASIDKGDFVTLY